MLHLIAIKDYYNGSLISALLVLVKIEYQPKVFCDNFVNSLLNEYVIQT